MDETAMRQALDVLRSQIGDRLPGDMLKGEVRMRQVLMQQMNVDESTADKLVKQLSQTGWLTFRGTGANDDEGNLLNPVVGMGGRAGEGGADTWTGDEAVGTADAGHVPAAPFIAGAAMTGMQTGSTATAAGAGPAVIGGAAAGLLGSDNVRTAGSRGTGEDGTVTGADIPDVNQDTIDSYAADANPSDPRGYWAIGTMPETMTGAMSQSMTGDVSPATRSGMAPTPTGTMPPTTGSGMAPATTDTMPAPAGNMPPSTSTMMSPAPASGVSHSTPGPMPPATGSDMSQSTTDTLPPTTTT